MRWLPEQCPRKPAPDLHIPDRSPFSGLLHWVPASMFNRSVLPTFKCQKEVQASQSAQENPPPVPGLRGRWEWSAWRPRWLRLGGGVPLPSDGPPAPRSSRLQQQGRLHPDGPALSAALHGSLAERPASCPAPQAAVGRHHARESSCRPRLAQPALPMQSSCTPSACASYMCAWLSVASTGKCRESSAVLHPNYESQSAPVPCSLAAR